MSEKGLPLIALGVNNEVGESVLNQEEVLQLATELGNKILKALKKSKEEMKMNRNKEQVMSETKISFDGEKVVTFVSNGRSNTTVTTMVDGVVISAAKEKTPQDVLDQGEQKEFVSITAISKGGISIISKK